MEFGSNEALPKKYQIRFVLNFDIDSLILFNGLVSTLFYFISGDINRGRFTRVT